jgi:hypothetical protein
MKMLRQGWAAASLSRRGTHPLHQTAALFDMVPFPSLSKLFRGQDPVNLCDGFLNSVYEALPGAFRSLYPLDVGLTLH